MKILIGAFLLSLSLSTVAMSDDEDQVKDNPVKTEVQDSKPSAKKEAEKAEKKEKAKKKKRSKKRCNGRTGTRLNRC